MAEEIHKYRLAYSQNVNGIISFSGSVHFDDIEKQQWEINCLVSTLQAAEHTFKNLGYEIAKNNNKEKLKPKTK